MGTMPILAMVTDSVGPYQAGGKEVRRSELARRLTDEFDIHIYTMKWWTGPSHMIRDGVRYHAICPRMALYCDTRRSNLQALVFALACLRLLWRRFDVIETDGLPYLHVFTLRLVSWLRGSRLVVTWHEVVGSGYLRSYVGVRGLLVYVIERFALRLPDTIITVSEHTAVRVAQILGSRTTVVSAPDGVDPWAIDEVDAVPPEVDVVTVGRLVGHKRVDLLLQVLANLKRVHGRVTCRVIGTGPERERLEEQAQRLGLDGEVEFRSDVTDRAELFGLMKSARVFVSTSEREGSGVAALEGLACGLPVIVTSAPDNLARYVVGRSERGTVCAPDMESVAVAVRIALDRTVSAETGEEAESTWAIAHSWTTAAERMAAALRGEPHLVERTPVVGGGGR